MDCNLFSQLKYRMANCSNYFYISIIINALIILMFLRFFAMGLVFNNTTNWAAVSVALRVQRIQAILFVPMRSQQMLILPQLLHDCFQLGGWVPEVALLCEIATQIFDLLLNTHFFHFKMFFLVLVSQYLYLLHTLSWSPKTDLLLANVKQEVFVPLLVPLFIDTILFLEELQFGGTWH